MKKRMSAENASIPVSPTAYFERLYLDVRSREQRVYSDDQLRQLPDIAASHRHFREWQIRKRSAQRLLCYIARKPEPVKILEVGCGNGWLAAKLAGIHGADVIAVDINRTEIEQAMRVFSKGNLQFSTGNFNPGNVVGGPFDIVVFAASLQYFPSLKGVLREVMACLSPDGEIHLLDTHFYTPARLAGAKKRTESYFAGQGYPGMSAYYFHHAFDDLRDFRYRVLYNPRSFLNRIFRQGPFYWICIKHSE